MPPFLDQIPESQTYTVKLGDLIPPDPTEEGSAAAEPVYEEVEQTLEFNFVISKALDDTNQMKSLDISSPKLGSVDVEYSSS